MVSTMKDLKLLRRLKQFSRIADTAILSDDGYFYVIGQGDCDSVIVEGLMTKAVSSNRTIEIRQLVKGEKKSVRSAVTEFLHKEVNRISRLKQGNYLGSFSLSKDTRRQMLEIAKTSLATHVEIESDGSEGRAYCFDVASIIGNSSYRSSYLMGYSGVPLSETAGEPFNITLRVDALAAIPNESYVCVYMSWVFLSWPPTGMELGLLSEIRKYVDLLIRSLVLR